VNQQTEIVNMKREIKFRAFWRDTLKLIIDFNNEYVIDACNDEVFIANQFTGLKDKNGQEIYEGDIIVWSGTLDGCIFNHVCEVIFDLYQWCGWAIYSPQQKSTIPFGEHGCNPNKVNIVGNVYENKELLKTN